MQAQLGRWLWLLQVKCCKNRISVPDLEEVARRSGEDAGDEDRECEGEDGVEIREHEEEDDRHLGIAFRVCDRWVRCCAVDVGGLLVQVPDFQKEKRAEYMKLENCRY
jgi:hypothetical protein